MDIFNLKGKVTVITGASGGIGRALVRGFLEARALVLAVVRRSGIDWGDDISRGNGNFRQLEFDLSKPETAKELTAAALEAGGGRIDVLINNAAVSLPATADPFDEALRREVFNTNLETPYRLCGLIAPLMAERGGGSIINVASINAERAFPRNPAYVTT